MAFSLKAEQECERDRRECKHMHTVKKRAEYKKKVTKKHNVYLNNGINVCTAFLVLVYFFDLTLFSSLDFVSVYSCSIYSPSYGLLQSRAAIEYHW